MLRTEIKESKRSTLSPEQIDALKARNEELARMKFKVDELEQELAKLTLESNRRRRQIYQEQQSLNEITILKLNSSLEELPNRLSTLDKENAELLVSLLKLVSTKFSIETVFGQYNLLDNESMQISFSMGRRVGHELECQPALKYFKSLGDCTFSKDEGKPSYLSSKVVSFNIATCKAAIQGLQLLANPTADEREQRRQATVVAMC